MQPAPQLKKDSCTQLFSRFSIKNKIDHETRTPGIFNNLTKQNQNLSSSFFLNQSTKVCSVQNLVSKVQRPASRIESPASRVHHLESIIQSPTSRVQCPESCVQSPSSRAQSPAFRVQHPESVVDQRATWNPFQPKLKKLKIKKTHSVFNF